MGDYGVEEFTFADGAVWSSSDIASHYTPVTAGPDLLIGTEYDDTFDAGSGADTMVGKVRNRHHPSIASNRMATSDGDKVVTIFRRRIGNVSATAVRACVSYAGLGGTADARVHASWTAQPSDGMPSAKFSWALRLTDAGARERSGAFRATRPVLEDQ